jgi:MSHA biogenesis protein MshO
MQRVMQIRRGSWNHSRGFTMVELVVAMVVSTLIVGFIGMMITTPVEAFVAQSRRAEASDSAETAMRELSNDVHKALPHSLREGMFNGVRILEMIDVSGIATYGTPLTWTGGDMLNINVDDISFDAATAVLLTGPTTRVVVGNGTGAGIDVYQPTTTFGVVTPAGTIVTANASFDNFTLSANFRFTQDPPSKRAYLVSGVTRYECDTAAGELRRRRPPTIDAAIGPPAGPADIIARNISACSFQTVPASAEHGGVAIVAITVSRAVNGNAENVRLIRQLKVENAR